MTTEKNAIGFPTESGGFEEIASDAPKASPDGLTAQDVAYGNETVDDALTELNSKFALGEVYNIETVFTSGSVLDAINTLCSELSDNAIGVCVVNSDVTGRPVGTGWGQIILFKTYMLQECHVIYQDTWSAQSVSGRYKASEQTITWNTIYPTLITNVTTDANGNAEVGAPPANRVVVAFGNADSGNDYVYTPVYSRYMQKWYIHVTTWQGAIVPNVAITGWVYWGIFQN